ncbi:MAG: MarR family transcriptional regulator [Pseudomonadota bacterium]
MTVDFTRRFGILVNDVAKLYGEQFDRAARQRLGLSRRQCRVLGVLAMQGDAQPLSQAELAERLELSAMSIGTLCDHLEAAGWLRRRPHPADRRVNQILLQPSASEALDAALSIGDALQTRALAALTEAEHTQLVALLIKARDGLTPTPAEAAADATPRRSRRQPLNPPGAAGAASAAATAQRAGLRRPGWSTA